jgi:hypothetical protein
MAYRSLQLFYLFAVGLGYTLTYAEEHNFGNCLLEFPQRDSIASEGKNK